MLPWRLEGSAVGIIWASMVAAPFPSRSSCPGPARPACPTTPKLELTASPSPTPQWNCSVCSRSVAFALSCSCRWCRKHWLGLKCVHLFLPWQLPSTSTTAIQPQYHNPWIFKYLLHELFAQPLPQHSAMERNMIGSIVKLESIFVQPSQ